jgi:hypothetical protein
MYRIPTFVAETLASQLSAPRRVSLLGVAGAVLRGIDCVIYLAGGVFLLLMAWRALSFDPPAPAWFAPALFMFGVLAIALVAFRIWQVWNALKTGEARVAEIVRTEAGTARMWGTPWGDLAGGKLSAPPAARGTYQLPDQGETGSYYMQQRWALALNPGDAIWVLRVNGRDVLYAPKSSATGPPPP